MATNWLLELGIPFDPPPSPEEVLSLLDQREREFSLKANKGERGSYYSVMLERMDSIREELSNPERMAAFADEAKRVSYPVIDQLVERTFSNPEAEVDEAKMAETVQFAQDLIADRANMAHVILPDDLVYKRMRARAALNSDGAQASEEAERLYRSLVQTKPARQHKFRSFEADLEIFGVDNLYDYVLGVGAAWDEMRQASLSALIERAENKVGDYQKGTSERSAAERLRARVREVCASADEWSAYCDYLVWRDTKEALDMMGRMARLGSGDVPQDSFERVVSKVTALQGDAAVAQLVVRGYCEAQDPPLSLPKASKTDAADRSEAQKRGKSVDMPAIQADSSGINLVTCPHCGKRTRNGSFCMECGGSLATSLSGMHAAARQAATQAQRAAQGGANATGTGGVVGVSGVQQAPYRAAQMPAYNPAQLQEMPTYQQAANAQTWSQQVYSQPPTQPEKRSKAPIVVAAVLAIIAVALVAFVALGGPKALTSSGGQTSDASSETVTVDAGSVADCTGSTRIMPQFDDGTAMQRYRVALSKRAEEDSSGAYSEQLMELNVEGAGGFSLQDYAKYGAELSDQTYQLTITDSDTSREYRVYVNFTAITSKAPKSIEVICK